MRTRPIITLIPCLLAALAVPGLAQSERVFFSPRDRMDYEISKELDKAQSEIYMALYSISNESEWVDEPSPGSSESAFARWRAFRERLDNGDVMVFDMIKKKIQEDGLTKVRLVLHRAALDSWAVARAKDFEDIGVEVRWTHKTMHHKFAVIDKRTLISGSGNWSRGAAERYSENTIVFNNHYWLTRKFLYEFYYLWYNLMENDPPRAEIFDRNNLPEEEPFVRFFIPRDVKHYDTAAVEVYFTSENGSTSDYVCADKIIEEFWKAEESIIIMINHFNMSRIGRALRQVAEAKPHLEIKVLADLGEYDATDISQMDEIEGAGIESRYKFYSQGFYYPRAQFLHHKIAIIDRERMVTGSYNWSRTAEHKNYENITVHQGPSQQDLIDDVLEEFDQQWNLRPDLYDDFLAAVRSEPGDPDYKRYVPHHFLRDLDYFHSPMALTREQIDRVRESMETWGYRPPPKDDLLKILDRQPEDKKLSASELEWGGWSEVMEADGDGDGFVDKSELTRWMSRYNRLYFDKETGEFTDSQPSGTFIPNEDVIPVDTQFEDGETGGFVEGVELETEEALLEGE